MTNHRSEFVKCFNLKTDRTNVPLQLPRADCMAGTACRRSYSDYRCSSQNPLRSEGRAAGWGQTLGGRGHLWTRRPPVGGKHRVQSNTEWRCRLFSALCHHWSCLSSLCRLKHILIWVFLNLLFQYIILWLWFYTDDPHSLFLTLDFGAIVTNKNYFKFVLELWILWQTPHTTHASLALNIYPLQMHTNSLGAFTIQDVCIFRTTRCSLISLFGSDTMKSDKIQMWFKRLCFVSWTSFSVWTDHRSDWISQYE